MVNVNIKDYIIKDPIKLEELAREIGIDKARERVFMDMKDRRALEAA